MTKLLSDGEPIPAEAVEESELSLLGEGVAKLRAEFDALKRNYEREMRSVMSVLHSLRTALNGGIAEARATAPAAMQPPSEAAWQMWKQRLPGACPTVIDALLIQPLTPTQLISATGTSYSTVQRALSVLQNNSLIEKDGKKIRLKNL